MPQTSDKTSNTQHQDTSTTQSAYAPQVAGINTALTDAMGAYGQAKDVNAPSNYVASFDPSEIGAFQSMVGYGNNNAVPNGQAAAGTSLTNAGVSGTNGALTGLQGYDPASANNPDAIVAAANKYADGQDIPAQVKAAMQNATETARDVTMPGIEQNAALSGNTNSSRTGIAQGLVQRGLAEQSANLEGALRSQAFTNGLSLAQSQAQNNNTDKLSALGAQGTLGTAAAGQGNTASNSSVSNMIQQLSAAATGGAGLTAAQQAQLDNALKQYQAGVSAPFAPLQQLMSIMGGNYGTTTNSSGTSNTQEHTETQASPLQIAGGILGAGTSLLGSGGLNMLAPMGSGILSFMGGGK
jgi:hypothetical protein